MIRARTVARVRGRARGSRGRRTPLPHRQPGATARTAASRSRRSHRARRSAARPVHVRVAAAPAAAPATGRRARPGARAGPAGRGSPRRAAQRRRAARPGQEGRRGRRPVAPPSSPSSPPGQSKAPQRAAEPPGQAKKSLTAGGDPPGAVRLAAVQTRRQFVTRAGSAAAAAVLVPTSLALRALRAARARRPLLRGGDVGRAHAHGDLAVVAPARRRGRAERRPRGRHDKAFRHVVAHKRVATSGARGHALKARVTGLKAHEQYYYRFATKTTDGPVGRFRTALPADSRQPVRFAFFSCQDYTHGYYNAHELLADEDLDFVVCLGDYIYAESYHSRKGGTGGARRQDRHAPAATRRTSASRSRSPTTATSTRCTAPTRRCARCTRSSRW